MDAATLYADRSPSRSETSSPANSTTSLNLSLQQQLQEQQNTENLHRMGVFFQHAQHMHQMSLDVMKRISVPTVTPVVHSSPRHTIDAILGLNGTRRPPNGRQEHQEYMDCRSPRESRRSLTPGAGESAGKLF